ncbi:glycosyltransferase [Levilactobacillus brevis]|uniref:glycosyltransferase n=1 Tax=Levilactobacillus brevis TaxID=1580 RepID=UPI003DA707F0
MSTFNGASTLSMAIESILKQTYRDFELIICDDDSTDNTQQVLAKYQERDPRITIIKNKKNRGLPQSLNNCLKYAHGTLIARMDDDDVSLPTRLETQVDWLNKHPSISFVSSWLNIFDDDGIYGVQEYPEYPTKLELFSRNQFAHPAAMIRKTDLLSVNGYSEDDNVLRIEDYDLWMRMYAANLKGGNICKPLLNFREDKGSFSRRSTRSRINIVKLLVRSKRNFKLGLAGDFLVLKSLVKIMLPTFVYKFVHKYKYR